MQSDVSSIRRNLSSYTVFAFDTASSSAVNVVVCSALSSSVPLLVTSTANSGAQSTLFAPSGLASIILSRIFVMPSSTIGSTSYITLLSLIVQLFMLGSSAPGVVTYIIATIRSNGKSIASPLAIRLISITLDILSAV